LDFAHKKQGIEIVIVHYCGSYIFIRVLSGEKQDNDWRLGRESGDWIHSLSEANWQKHQACYLDFL